ncbi:S-adenosyl-L-methionine-dependent methyltransferase [Aspergillus karnatakaensis]|uniref:S-adenosyl-L-methionine-dependent methyltransferase n=1 Tax=Aspergillus karnatakaensis TaxID=1810916 RepID=UPI003CCDEB7C
MNALAQEIRKLHAEADEIGREKICNELGVLQASLASELNSILRLAGGVSIYNMPLCPQLEGISFNSLIQPFELALVKIGLDQGIFQALHERSHTLPELAKKTGLPLDVLELILRGQASGGMIKEEAGAFAANRFTALFSGSNACGALSYIFDMMVPVASALPGYLTEHEKPTMTSAHDTVFQRAFETDLSIFDWAKKHPERLGGLFKLLALLSTIQDWTEAFPIAEEIGSFTSYGRERAVLVDVGGGAGPQSALFKQRFPHLTGRVIVQDFPEALAQADPIDGVEFMEYDCFTPQPIKGAKFYYLRYVLHLWQDDKCVAALKSIIPAMDPESRILIDEAVVPAAGATWQVAWLGIEMAATMAGVERTRARWENLLDEAGLKILNIFPYDSNGQSIIMAVPRH